jgi:uncharacterized protein with HEPN domain
VNWKNVIGMGHRLKHQYFRVETKTVWDVVNRHFPVLLKVVERMLEETQVSEPAIWASILKDKLDGDGLGPS